VVRCGARFPDKILSNSAKKRGRHKKVKLLEVLLLIEDFKIFFVDFS
jgi:hypothetical protein